MMDDISVQFKSFTLAVIDENEKRVNKNIEFKARIERKRKTLNTLQAKHAAFFRAHEENCNFGTEIVVDVGNIFFCWTE